MDAETKDLLRGAIREMFNSDAGDIVDGLTELGWADVVAEDPDEAVDLLFTEQGLTGKASSALNTVVHAVDDHGNTHPVVHPLGTATARAAGGTFEIDGVLLADVDRPSVIATADGSTFLVDASTLAGGATPVGGFDAASRLRRVRLSIDAALASPVDVDWAAVSTSARRALAAELVGNGTAMLQLAVAQIADRHQFGRPIGANQSPRHRLADAYALLGGAAELVRAAWKSGSAWDARVAKAYAGLAVDTTSRACLQVCGAIGLTTEHSLPGYVQRARVLDALYGGWSAEMEKIGGELLTTTAVPAGDRL